VNPDTHEEDHFTCMKHISMYRTQLNLNHSTSLSYWVRPLYNMLGVITFLV